MRAAGRRARGGARRGRHDPARHVVNVGKDGKPLRPAITWLDQRRARTVPPVGSLWRAAFKAAQVAGTVDHFRGEAEINWIRAHQPQVWEATHKFLLLSGYLNWRLCGRFADSTVSQVGIAIDPLQTFPCDAGTECQRPMTASKR